MVAIETNEVVRELIGLLTNHKFVSIYVEPINNEKAGGGKGNEKGNGMNMMIILQMLMMILLMGYHWRGMMSSLLMLMRI